MKLGWGEFAARIKLSTYDYFTIGGLIPKLYKKMFRKGKKNE